MMDSTRKKMIVLAAIVVGELVLLLAVFSLGLAIGFRKAEFSYRWGENYNHVFGGPRAGLMRPITGRDYISGHGVAGTIVKIDGNSLVINGKDSEKLISVSKGTIIRKGQGIITTSSLDIDDRIMVVGSPQGDGSIAAKMIRVFDGASPTPQAPSSTP